MADYKFVLGTRFKIVKKNQVKYCQEMLRILTGFFLETKEKQVIFNLGLLLDKINIYQLVTEF